MFGAATSARRAGTLSLAVAGPPASDRPCLEPDDIYFELPAGNAGDSLIVMRDGTSVGRMAGNRLQTLRPFFAWRGAGRVRLVLTVSGGAKVEWRWWRSTLTTHDWRLLCQWLVWLERGPRLRRESDPRIE